MTKTKTKTNTKTKTKTKTKTNTKPLYDRPGKEGPDTRFIGGEFVIPVF